MTPIHVHLFLNHVPWVGMVFGLVFFIAGLKASFERTLLTSLRIFIASCVTAVPVAVTGLVSADALEGAAWLDPAAVGRHQLAGILTLIVLLGLAALSGVVLFAWSRRGARIPARAKTAILVLALAGLGLALWTSSLGGAIRHTELADRRGAHPGDLGERGERP